MSPTSFIEFRNITRFCSPTQKACDDVTFSVKRGTVHAIVGENGAGKSTLMNVLGGIFHADSGEMFIAGKSYRPESAKDAFHQRIGFIHQHFLLADHLTVLEHLILNWPRPSLFRPLSTGALIEKVNSFSQKFKWKLNLKARIDSLSVGEQQRVEIIKALLSDPEIIIFDEPTAVLAPQEIEDFLKFILQLKHEGKTILLISHKLNEIKEVSDQITVLRHGKSVLTDLTSNLSVTAIAEKMIGQQLNATLKQSECVTEGELTQVPRANINLRRGEILGVAGIEGNGQSELIEKVLQHVKSLNVSYGDIPEDRLRFGLFPGLNLTEHMILRHPKLLSPGGFIRKDKALLATESVVRSWDVRPHRVDIEADRLSGGNQQKFVIGRELFHDPDFILAAHPSRGVDLGAQQMIHSALATKKSEGKSILLVSSDLDEVLKMSDAYFIVSHAKLYGPFKKEQLNEIEIGQFMTGSHPDQFQFLHGEVL